MPNGVWTNASVVRPDNTHSYKTTVECVTGGKDQGNTSAEHCDAVSMRQCTAGKNGAMVQWYSSLKAIQPPDWQKVGSPTCVYDANPVDLLAEIAARIQTDFQHLPVSPGTATTQPSPFTLNSWQTNFISNAAPQQFNITLLGQRVRITATPLSYTYIYGDGHSLGPISTPGQSIPQAQWGQLQTATSHRYEQTKDYTARIIVHFAGTYSVNDGPTTPIPGQGNFSTAEIPVKVWLIKKRWVSQDCQQNPQSWGCQNSASHTGNN
ncbi:hypothetical protein [Psychromicrobium sp. YIM B11713]|uniref:hypothetical protein n=1 Tax=Psychromicrobium sp. YIM B11713 TaxID=3145233 RepID=UPI00374EDE65